MNEDITFIQLQKFAVLSTVIGRCKYVLNKKQKVHSNARFFDQKLINYFLVISNSQNQCEIANSVINFFP